MFMSEYIDNLSAKGRSYFTFCEAKTDIGSSETALRASIRRLKTKKELFSPLQGYFVIVPPEYRSLGALPPDQFIHDLMMYLKIPYHVGLLTAGQYYGAAHQQFQNFQLVVARQHRNIKVGRVKITFITNKYVENMPIKQFNTPRGILNVATPEAIVLELMNYPSHCLGLDYAFTVIKDLVNQLDFDVFKKVVAMEKTMPSLQRLGYILELLGKEKYAEACFEKLICNDYRTVILDIRHPENKGIFVDKWKLIINLKMESEFDF